MKQTILLTALPLEIRSGKPRLAVYVSPRLEPDAGQKLEKFETFLNWPTALRERLEFTVEIQGMAPIQAKLVSEPVEPLWDNLFKKTTPIRSAPDRKYEERVIRSYSVGGVMNHIQGLYRAVAESSIADHPVYIPSDTSGPASPIVDFIQDIGQLIRQEGKTSTTRGGGVRRARLTDGLYNSERRALNYDTLFASMTQEQKKQAQFALAYEFHERPGSRSREGAAKFAKVEKPEMEFHEIVAALANYPEILVRTGLVFELELDTMSPLPGTGKIRVNPKWVKGKPAYAVEAVQPWTWFNVSGVRFEPKPRSGGDFRNRMVILDNADDDFLKVNEKSGDVRYRIAQIDPDGAAMKTVDYAKNFFRLRSQNRPYTMEDTAALPAMKTAGIGVFRHNRSFEVQKHLVAMAQVMQNFKSSTETELYLDDVLRGYRVDILDEDGKWYSLHRRLGFYHFTEPDGAYTTDNPAVLEDEGFIRGASATSDLDETEDLYLHEAICRWEGWSLSAPRPGKTIVTQEADPSEPVDPSKPYEVPREKLNSAAGVKDVYMETNFKPSEKSLPKLRFGKKYRLRMRTVDLAGKGPSLEDAPKDPDLVSNELYYTRFEPVAQPFVVLRDPVTEGESAERLVIRSDYDATAEEYKLRVKTQFGKDYATESARFLTPPKTAELMAETHGAFDKWLKAGEIQYAYNVARREEGTFLDTTIFDPNNPETPIPVNGIEIVTPPSVTYDPSGDPPKQPIKIKVLKDSDVTDSSKEVWRRGEPLAPGQYVIHRTIELKLPYLPDVFARGAALEGLRDAMTGGGDGLTRIELIPPGSTQKRRVLMVPFKGEWPFLDTFLLRIIEREGKMEGNNCDETFANATNPPTWDGKVLTVYVGKAEVQKIRYSSFIGADDAEKMGIAKWLKGSSRRNDALKFATAGQNWMMTPFRELTLVHAVQHPLCTPTILKLTPSRRLGDTFAQFRGNIEASVPSTGRLDMKGWWRDMIDRLEDPAPKEIIGTADAFHFDVKDTLKNQFAFPEQTGKPIDYFKHEFGDTRYRKIEYFLIGTSRFREYFPESIWLDPKNITREGERFEIKVKSSARPAAPNVLYILPTFGWEPPTKVGDEIVSKRCGGGLRVYLDRPWYSSGAEELLGVIIPSSPIVPEGSPLRPFVTQWGIDPIYMGYQTYNGVQVGHFKSYVGSPGYQLSLDEYRGDKVNVVGYEPKYDEVRKLWYCDIEVDAGPAYTPFLRLALARYQPNSIPDAHLSRVVLADYAQLAPDRSASIVTVAPTMINIFVSGVPAMSIGSGEMSPGAKLTPVQRMALTRQVTASLELQTDPSNPEFGWAPVGTSEVELTPTYQKEFGTKILWQGRMKLPEVSPVKNKYRVVIKEWETLQSDRHPRAFQREGKFWMRRLVYADAIILQ